MLLPLHAASESALQKLKDMHATATWTGDKGRANAAVVLKFDAAALFNFCDRGFERESNSHSGHVLLPMGSRVPQERCWGSKAMSVHDSLTQLPTTGPSGGLWVE